MKKLKVTLEIVLNLPDDAEVLPHLHSEGEDLGAHLKIGGKFFRPFVSWFVFRPRTLNSAAEDQAGLGHGWQSCDAAEEDYFFSHEEDPDHPYTFEEIG